MVMVSSASLDTIVVGDMFVLYNTFQCIAFECGCLCQLHTHLLATVLLLQLWDSCPIESSVLHELLHNASYACCHCWWHWGLSVSMRVNDTESQVNAQGKDAFSRPSLTRILGIHLFKFLCRSPTFALFWGYLIFTISKLHASQYKLCIKNSANFRWTLHMLRTLILK